MIFYNMVLTYITRSYETWGLGRRKIECLAIKNVEPIKYEYGGCYGNLVRCIDMLNILYRLYKLICLLQPS